MKIVIGRGNQRKVYELPCANIIVRGNDTDVRILLANVRSMVGVETA